MESKFITNFGRFKLFEDSKCSSLSSERGDHLRCHPSEVQTIITKRIFCSLVPFCPKWYRSQTIIQVAKSFKKWTVQSTDAMTQMSQNFRSHRNAPIWRSPGLRCVLFQRRSLDPRCHLELRTCSAKVFAIAKYILERGTLLPLSSHLPSQCEVHTLVFTHTSYLFTSKFEPFVW